MRYIYTWVKIGDLPYNIEGLPILYGKPPVYHTYNAQMKLMQIRFQITKQKIC